MELSYIHEIEQNLGYIKDLHKMLASCRFPVNMKSIAGKLKLIDLTLFKFVKGRTTFI